VEWRRKGGVGVSECRYCDVANDDDSREFHICESCQVQRPWEKGAVIKDSGVRREFETGAVRDVAEGKGRCDLLPLDVVGDMVGSLELVLIDRYVRTGDVKALVHAVKTFCHCEHADIYSLMLDVAKHYEAGAAKYEERNWEKGMPLHCYVDSAVRHYLKLRRGDMDEPHDLAFVWNLLCAIWTHRHKSELIDLPFGG